MPATPSLRSATAMALLAILAAASPALAGPLWISIEYPANPFDPATRGATLLVHAYHHGDAITAPLSGTAEGLVDGRRRSLPLTFVATDRPGIYALTTAVPTKGSWVLAITLTDHQQTATALVTTDGTGRIASTTVPTDRRNGWLIPRTIGAGDIDAALREADALTRAQATLEKAHPATRSGLGFGAVGLLPALLALAAFGYPRRH